MVKQAPVQLLEHGKALCGKVFSRFVESWNWLFSFFVEMRGDADLDPATGHITRDDSGAFPVFRLVNAGTLGGGGGGEGGPITFTGTDGSSETGNSVVFAHDADTNLTVHVSKDAETGVVTLSFGVRWMNV